MEPNTRAGDRQADPCPPAAASSAASRPRAPRRPRQSRSSAPDCRPVRRGRGGGRARRDALLAVRPRSPPSSADAFQVPRGLPRRRPDPLRGRVRQRQRRDRSRWGYNNDFLAFFPLGGKADEGLLFVNHEYPSPFFQHGYKELDLNPGKHTKSAADRPGRAGRRSATRSCTSSAARDGVWTRRLARRRTTAASTRRTRPVVLEFTGPRAGERPADRRARPSARSATASGGIDAVGHRALVRGELRRLRARPRQLTTSSTAGRTGTTACPRTPSTTPARGYRADGRRTPKYGWVCEHDPYDPSDSRPQAHRARALPPREHRVPPRARASRSSSTWATTRPTRASTGSSPSRSYQPGRPRQQPADPRGGHALRRALRSRRAGAGSPSTATPSRSPPPRAPARGCRCSTSELARHARPSCAARFAAGGENDTALRHQPARGRRGRPGRRASTSR